jgi:hypothetical protein
MNDEGFCANPDAGRSSNNRKKPFSNPASYRYVIFGRGAGAW